MPGLSTQPPTPESSDCDIEALNQRTLAERWPEHGSDSDSDELPQAIESSGGEEEEEELELPRAVGADCSCMKFFKSDEGCKILHQQKAWRSCVGSFLCDVD